MSQLLTLSRAAHLLGVTRAALQKRIREGELQAFDGMVSTDDLLQLFPEIKLEDFGAFEKMVGIRDDAFAKRLRERVLPTQEVLAQRLFEQGQELAELRRHLGRYHRLVESLRDRLARTPSLSAAAVAELIDAGLADVLASPLPSPNQQVLDGMDAMLRVMSAHVSMKPSGHEFFVEGSESLLKASLRAGLSPNYGCGNGTCGLCKARVVDGEVRQIAPSDYVFSGAEKAQGHVLMCSCTAVSSDVVLEVLEADTPADIPEQHLVTKVRSVDRLAADVIRLHLQTPRSNRLRFLAGQRVTLGTASSGQGSDSHGEYAIASCPCDDRNLIFHILRTEDKECRPANPQQGIPFGHANDDFAARLFAGMITVGQDISVWGPWGDFVLVKENGLVVRPQIFAAIDTGFAAINSLIEHAVAVESAEPMILVWASTCGQGPYLANQARAWGDALDGFRYLPVTVDELAATLLALPEIGVSDIYLAGPDDAVALTKAALLAGGVLAERLQAQGF
jgi:CDP-4-dehydro-6-deoxyglucose reductase